MNYSEKSLQELEEITILALRASNQVYKSLGKEGLVNVRKNNHGDMALRMDIEAEEAVLRVLKENKLPITVFSEEHNVVNLNSQAHYLGILDGLDGSNLYKEKYDHGRYATMFAIFSNTDPFYSDYLVCGIMEHRTSELYFATKGEGSKLLAGKKITPLICIEGENHKLNADTYFDEISHQDIITSKMQNFKEYQVDCLRSSAIHYVNLITGKIDGVIESTRKGNLEIAVAYGLVAEVGGVMISGNGGNISNQKYNTFGKKDHIPVISASSKRVADKLLSIFNS